MAAPSATVPRRAACNAESISRHFPFQEVLAKIRMPTGRPSLTSTRTEGIKFEFLCSGIRGIQEIRAALRHGKPGVNILRAIAEISKEPNLVVTIFTRFSMSRQAASGQTCSSHCIVSAVPCRHRQAAMPVGWRITLHTRHHRGRFAAGTESVVGQKQTS